MGVNRRERDELLAGLSLDALDTDGDRAVAEDAAMDPESGLILADMRNVVAALGEADSLTPPDDLYGSIVSTISSLAPSTSVAPAGAVAVFHHMVEAMAFRLSELSPEVCTRRAEPYDWSIQGLIAHLASIEQYTAAKLGLADFEYPADREMDHLGLGEHVIEHELTHPPAVTFAAWRDAAMRLVAHGEDLDAAALESEVMFHGFPIRVSMLYVLRAFEVWTHIEDVSRAGGLGEMIPDPADLKAMSETSVALARWVMGMAAEEIGNGLLHLVLTGDGGGVFPVRFGKGEGPPTTAVTDVVDYCRMAAQRIAVADIEVEVDGDADLVTAFLEAAATIAV